MKWPIEVWGAEQDMLENGVKRGGRTGPSY